jgi:phosphoserine phosphatase RsbU/P
MPVGQLIGAWDDGAFTAARIRLDRGDTLLLYTDGLIEARTITSTGRYGDEALHAFAANLAPTTAAAVIAAITDLLDGLGNGVDDDTAVLALSVPGPPR